MACAAATAVINIIENENLIKNVNTVSAYFKEQALTIPQVKNIKGRGLMLGLEFEDNVAELRSKLIYNEFIFTGSASQKNLLRILPPLSISKEDIDRFFIGLKNALKDI